jgi:hypothetical protein
MGTVNSPKKGKTIRPRKRRAQTPAAGGNGRDTQPGAKRVEPEVLGSPLNNALEKIFREHSGRFLNRLGSRQSGKYFQDLDEKAYNFIRRNYRIISGSFPFLNDELIRCDSSGEKDRFKNTAVEITAMLEGEGGADRFNRGEIEKSNRRWGIDDLETHTNNILRRKAGVGSVVAPQKANSVVACAFKDNAKKPKTVTDLRLAVNIPETELIDSEFAYKAGAAYLVKEIICKHLHESLDGKNGTEDDDSGGFPDGLLNGRVEMNSGDLEKHLQKIDENDEIEEIRDKGFSAASNLIVSILNAVNLDCQFLKNMRDKRELLIREYEDDDEAVLPDEHYQIRLSYFSKARLLEEREAYDGRIRDLSVETRRLWDLLEVIYQDSKSVFKVNDFEDLVRKNKSRINELIKNRTVGGEGIPYETPKTAGAPFAEPPRGEKEKIRLLLAKMEERIKNISDNMYPVERQISEERLSMLKNEFSGFEDRINPYNLQPGILVDIDLTSIKRKRTTLDSMASALGNFLNSVSGCFNTGNN